MPNILKNITLVSGYHPSAYQAIVTVDVDPDANRVIILNRMDLKQFANKEIHTPVVKLRVPVEFIIDNNLIVGILDDNGVYDCKIVDGIRAEILTPIVPVIRS
ncbi:hypothetical protein G3465_12325 [Shewanella baltica]|uniref:hypothetical protein n=1 Tax=Shewanella baltica TaxID=62322 RepID=UPI00217DDA5E|nr:hypothetical protein [Shewanella baltica]MCS6153680.1 hypothetical protein [Shewanella baltica]